MELLSKPRERRRCWNSEIPPSWLLVCGAIAAQVRLTVSFSSPRLSGSETLRLALNTFTFNSQVGFGLFPVVVRRFTMTVNPFIFSFYKYANLQQCQY